MEQHLSNRSRSLAESQTLAMAAKARELEAQGTQIIKLNLGEPDFQTPEYIKDAAKQAITDGYTFYPPVQGFPDLIEGIVNKLKRDNGLTYGKENVIVSTGAKHSITNVMLSLLNKADEVIVFSPFWVSYQEQIKLAEGVPVYIKGNINNDFKVTAQQLKAAITPKTKIVIFSSPCNPTGSVFSRQELRSLAEVLIPHDNIFIISDEIYEYITFKGKHESIAQFESIKDRVILVNGFSKGFAMTGWRLGYIAAPAWIVKACKKIQGQVTSGACSIAQKAAVAAINGDRSAAEIMRQAYLRRRNLVKSLLSEVEGVKMNTPEGAFYIFPDISFYFGKSYDNSKIANSYDLAMFLLNEAHVSVVDGTAFGDPNCVRISFAASDESLKKAVANIKTALVKLK